MGLIRDLHDITIDEIIKLCSFNIENMKSKFLFISYKNNIKNISIPGFQFLSSVPRIIKTIRNYLNPKLFQ